MPRVSYRRPLDQPFGTARIFDWIVESLNVGRFRIFTVISAFAKEGPLLRIKPHLERFRAAGGMAQALVGIDQRGTSIQALKLALTELDRVLIWHHPSPFTTFHPKLYFFEGPDRGEIYVGSNNLTVGGLETNCEAGVLLSYDLPAERDAWTGATESWTQLVDHPNTVKLDLGVLSKLVEDDVLLDETAVIGRLGTAGVRAAITGTKQPLFPYSAILPPTVRPKPLTVRARRAAPGATRAAATVAATVVPGIPRALVIQIVPHHNGEVFLSKRAINQYPAFFGYPFTGMTIPKTAGNEPYPQRTPDPTTEWKVYDRRGRVLRSLEDFRLNTVYYKRKGEIRITIPPDVARQIQPKSILVMTRPSTGSALDYQCEVFAPGSKQFRSLLPACTETMPAGGAHEPRKFGWL